MTVKLQRCSARRAGEQRPALVALLLDAVDSGASVGFLAPLPPEEAEHYWLGVEQALAHGHRELLLAERDGAVVGTVQLELASEPNARHRAGVTTLLVATAARRQGIGRILLTETEQLARTHGRSLLVAEVRQGDGAEQLCLRLGYVRAGLIPGYVRSTRETLEATALLYRVLEPAPGASAP